MATDEISPRLRAHRRLFLFTVANFVAFALPVMIDKIVPGPVRIGITAAVTAAGLLAAPLILRKIRKTPVGRTEIAPTLRRLALTYACLLAVVAFVEVPYGLADVVGSMAVAALVSLCYSRSWWGLPDSIMFWRYSTDQA